MASKEYRFTLGFTYYNEPELLSKQIEYWMQYPGEIQIILVDDGSQVHPAKEVFDRIDNYQDDKDIQLWRVTEDVGFNSHGCRNLIASIADSETVFFLDIDCFISPSDVAFLKRVRFRPEAVYFFNLYNVEKRKFTPWPGHINVFAVNKNTFWKAGGYDESFTGFHLGDREFHQRLEENTIKTKVSESVGINIHRGGRKTKYNPTAGLDKIHYDNENMIMHLDKLPPPEEELRGQLETKLNFPYERLL